MTYRERVAEFAGYCVGSCYGDWHPAVEAEEQAVLTDDGKYFAWRRRYEDFHDQRKRGGGVLVSLPEVAS